MVETDDTCPSTHTIPCTLARGHDGPHTAFRTRVSWTGDVDATARLREQPPPGAIELSVEQARFSPCRSQRGAVVFAANGPAIGIHGRGHNRKPDGFDCDGSDLCKASCRTEAVHAEQKALLNAGPAARGADLLHVKVVGGALVASGGPSCVQCSKLARSAGIKGVWLFHESGWQRYSAYEFHRLSLLAERSLLSPLRSTPTVRPIERTKAYGRCDECQHLFSPSELDAERGDPTWGHTCFGSFKGNRRKPGTARCESYRVPMVECSPLRSTPQEGTTDEWQPIESAPKDGTVILAWREGWVKPTLLLWLAHRDLDGSGWCPYERQPIRPKGSFPTHWMPLHPTPADERVKVAALSALQTIEGTTDERSYASPSLVTEGRTGSSRSPQPKGSQR